MGSQRPIAIAVFGMSEHELRILRTICLFSRDRARTYELSSVDAPQKPDFAIVNGDDPDALAVWNSFKSTNPMLPVVSVGNGPAPGWGVQHITRPLIATRLLPLLDQVDLSQERPAFLQPDEASAGPAAPAAPQQVTQDRAAQPKRPELAALVVDDSFPIREQIKLELQPLVGQVDLAETGERAMELITGRLYDIVFLDVVLPGMDGYQICRTIKRDKRTKGTAVIMLTGKSSPFDRVKGKLAGCDTYLTKPVDHITFQQVVRQYSIG